MPRKPRIKRKRTSKGVNDTIVACATPSGYSSIAVLRISGPDAIPLLKKIFISVQNISVFQSGHIYYGKIINPSSNETIDYVLASIFYSPNSYTGEDVVEISCHGNPLIVDQIITILINLGARLAQPGEFTKRAFLNNKIDLIQAEAVLDTVYAQCNTMRKIAIYQLEGKLSKILEGIKEEITQLLTEIEACIDFPEEEEAVLDLSKVKDEIENIKAKIDTILQDSQHSVKLKQGYTVVIAGRPNVGKSTLFNRLLGYERAIVYEIPGTTRDFIEEETEIEGLLVRLIDTAGIFTNAQGADKIANDRSIELLNKSDLVLLVFDGSEPLTEQDTYLINLTKDIKKVFILNKIDLNLKLKDNEILSDAVKVSAKNGENIDILKRVIRENLFPSHINENNLLVRQRQISAFKSLQKILANIEINQPLDTIAFELHNCLEIIGELTGRVLREDILNRIFEEFCIGK
uniref:tRNA modification GTPase MnmE n=1 Tax=candidate division WOR-3 bacterium TaxID=2052148 RepID=A0A7V3RGN1_UNCW3